MTIGAKFSLGLASTLLLVVAVMVPAYTSFELQNEKKQLEMFSRMTGRFIEESLMAVMLERNSSVLNGKLADIKEGADLISDIWLLNAEGIVKSSTDSASLGRKLSGGREASQEDGGEWQVSVFESRNEYRLVQPVANKGPCHRCHGPHKKYIGAIVIDFALGRVINDVLRKIAGAAAIMLVALASTGAGIFVLWHLLISRRLKPLLEKMRLLKEGTYSSGAAAGTNDEFARLEADFHAMADAIQARDGEKENLLCRLSETNADLVNENGMRRQGEAMLRDQKLFADSLIQNSAVATFVLDGGHQVITWNSACEKLTGISAAEVVGTDGHWKAFYPEQRPTLADLVLDGDTGNLSALYAQHDRSTLVPDGLRAGGWYRNMNGKDRYIIFDAAPILDSKGELIAVIETIQDVTDQKSMEAALGRSEAQLRTIIETEPECVMVVGSDGTILEINRAGIAMLEADRPDQVIGKAMLDFILPEHRHAVLAHRERVLTGEPESIDFEITGVKGSRRWFETRAARLPDPDGRTCAFLAVTRDITERKLWEKKLQEQLQFLQVLMDTIPMPVFYKDVQGLYLGGNKAFEDYLNIPVESFIGKSVYDIAPRELADEYYRKDRELFENPGVQVYDFSVKRADASVRDVIFNKATYTDAKGKVAGLIGVIQDITDRKRAEAVIRRHYDTQTAINWILHISLENAPLDNILKQTLDLILTISWLSFEARGAILLVGDDPGKLIMKAHRGLADSIQEECRMVPFGKCLCGRAAARGEVQFSDTLDDRHETTYKGMRDHGHYCVPIKHGREVLGVINIYLKKGHAADEKEIEFLMAIANALAGVIRRRRAESALQESEKRYRTLAETAHDVIFILDRKGEVTYVNNYGAGLFEGTVQDFIGKNIEDVFPPETAGQQRDNLAQVLETGESLYVENPFLLGERATWLGTWLVPLKDQDGFVSAALGVSRDITDRIRNEQEREKLIRDLQTALKLIFRSHKEWQDTFDSITDMIAIVDRDFNIVKANKAFAAYFRLHPKDFINRKCHEFFHKTGTPIAGCSHVKTVAERKAFAGEVLDGSTNRNFRITTFPYLSPDGEIIGSIHVSHDITEEKEREKRLIVSERLAALGQMASGIAHEINNPLASIAGCSEGLLSRVKRGQYDKKLFETYLNIIQEEIFRCKTITTSMLSFVRKTTYETKEVNINSVLDRTVEIISYQGRLKNVEIIRAYQDPAPEVRANEGELRQVFLALITNALDAMDDKGVLTLKSETAADGVRVHIGDTGSGIDTESLNRIFDPFYTTKSEKGGTGLGLSIARKIIHNHSGNIAASSEPGKGSVFTIDLPR